METFTVVLAVLSVVFFILDIILFFKLWVACNDIRRIADKCDPETKAERERKVREYKPMFHTPETKEDIERWLNEDK